MFFDTHAHLDDEQFQADQNAVIVRAQEAGVELLVNVGYNVKSAQNTLELTRKYSFIYGAVGMHPHDAKDYGESSYELFRKIAGDPRIVAIGEIGLDYHYDLSPRDTQKQVFRRMIALAKEVRLPVIIHDREAHEDTFAIVQEEGAFQVGGIFHCYSGSLPLAKVALDLGFYISFAGPVTFANAHKLREVVKEAPLERILIETDCPYLAPAPYRGKRNEPAFVPKVAATIAQLKGLTIEEAARVTLENGKRVFKIQ